MKKTIIALMALTGAAVAATTPEWSFVDNGNGTATYSVTLNGNYTIALGEAAIENGEAFTLIVETTASGWANQYGSGLVSTNDPYNYNTTAEKADDNFRMYFGSDNNSERVVVGINRWSYGSSESKLTGVDASNVPALKTGSNAETVSPLTLGMVLTYNGSNLLTVTNTADSDIKFSISESNIVGSFNFATLTNTGAASIPNAQTSISITKAYTAPIAPAVPEPATATLSLLALAGLVMRRRRK